MTTTRTLDPEDLGELELAEPRSFDRQVHLVWRASQIVLFAQLVGMLVFNTVQYSRFDLTIDFANYSQACSAIAHGHLDPYSSLLGLSFWRNDFELLMWPLALLYWLYPHTVALLWLQALAVVGAELVVVAWVRESITTFGQRSSRGAPILGLVTGLLVVTPWSWFTIGSDFHLEPFAALFALLAARDLWAGRRPRLLLWVPLTLVSCAVAGSLYVIAVGLAALLTRRGPRVVPALVLLAGCSWLAFAAAIGGTELGGQHALASGYGYLTGQGVSHLSYSHILPSLVEHPLRALDMFRSHAGYVAGYVASGGVIGLTSRWGLFPAAIVLLPSALNASPLFIHWTAAFQSWAAVLFLIVGTALALQHLREDVLTRGVIAVFGGLVLAVSLGVGIITAQEVPLLLQRVSSTAAAKLAEVDERVPQGAEVIASQSIIGRFATGRVAYYFPRIPERYFVNGADQPVWFVLGPVQGPPDGAEIMRAVSYLGRHMHATLVAEGAGIWAFQWIPPRGVTSVLLP